MGLHKGRPSYRRSHTKRTSSTSKHEISKIFLILICRVGHFCRPGSRSGYGPTELIETGSNPDPGSETLISRVSRILLIRDFRLVFLFIVVFIFFSLYNRLAATVVVGAMYEKLGRMMGRSYEETVQVSFRLFV